MAAPFAVKAYVFDAYGTLFDVHSVIAECEQHYPGKGGELSRLWRQKQLEYTWLRSLMQRYRDFEHVTLDALKFATQSLELTLDEFASGRLITAYRHLTPYPEVATTLDALKGKPRAILSNGSPDMLEAVVKNAGFTSKLEAVLSVHSRGVFKPHPSVYRMAVDHLGVPAAEIAFVSSNAWDASGAASFGFKVFWINRTGAAFDQLGYTPAAVLTSLDQLLQHTM